MQSSHDALRLVYYQIVCDVITLKMNALNEGAPSSLARLPRAPAFFLAPTSFKLLALVHSSQT